MIKLHLIPLHWDHHGLLLNPCFFSEQPNSGPTPMKCNKGTLITDPLAIASKFSDFFINIGPSLAATIPSRLMDHNGTYSNSFFISPNSLDEIIDTISKLKTSNSEGINGINLRGIKASADLLAAPLSNISNFSFSTGTVLDKLKISRVVPVYKS